jgi:hypothetical protein
VIAYASRTGTARNLDMLRARGWRLLVSATGVWRTEGFPYAIDNGAWSAWNAKPRRARLDLHLFIGIVLALGADADWVVCPDIVGGGQESLRLSLRWLPWVLKHAPAAVIAVQEGISDSDIAPHLGPRVGVFVGGASDEWKERSVGRWAALARAHGARCHVGRVNTQRRIAICGAAGATSFDGTSASRFAKSIPVLQRALVQGSLLIDTGDNE